jgi:hypothetical protein
MKVKDIRRSRLMFKEAGGIMLDAVGQPCDQLANKVLKLSFDVRRTSGNRLVLRLGNRIYNVVGVDERDLRAIAEFSEDQKAVLVNATIPDVNQKSCPSPSGLRLISLHPVFLNTRLGWLLTRMDTIAWSFSNSKRWATQEPLPASTLPLATQLSNTLQADYRRYDEDQYAIQRNLIASGPAALARLSPELRLRLRQSVEAGKAADWERYEREILEKAAIDRKSWDSLSQTDRRILLLMSNTGTRRVSNINDHESPPTFCVENSALALKGTPRLEFFKEWYETSYPLQDSTNLMSSNFSRLRLVDEEAYDATMEIYMLSGLFRYVREQQSPVLWKQFVRGLPAKARQDTYDIACPECTSKQVKDWLACLASGTADNP